MVDELFRALADERRRRLLKGLAERGGDELRPVAEIYPGELECDGVEGGDERGEREGEGGAGNGDLAIELAHVHLPLLADAGYIRWSRAAGEHRIGVGPEFSAVKPALESAAVEGESGDEAEAEFEFEERPND